MIEPSFVVAKCDIKFQFERHGHFVADRVVLAEGESALNLTVGLKDA